jgi:multidrug efflux pump subunit AcrA (membrane-fusion protein)
LKKFSALIVVGVALLFVFEWRPWHQLPMVDPAPAPALIVVKDELSTKVVDQDIRAQLSAVAYTTIVSELGARIQSLPVKEGGAQRAQLQKAVALLSMAERNYEANSKLLELGSIGRIESENSYSEYLKFKAEHEEILSTIRRCRISAPYSGMVFEQKARAQQFVQAGQPVMEILDNSALELEFIVPSKWSPWLVKGYHFNIKLDETDKTYPAQITRINGKIDSVSQTIKVAAVINGTFKELSPGMSGVIVIAPPDVASNKQNAATKAQ